MWRNKTTLDTTNNKSHSRFPKLVPVISQRLDTTYFPVVVTEL